MEFGESDSSNFRLNKTILFNRQSVLTLFYNVSGLTIMSLSLRKTIAHRIAAHFLDCSRVAFKKLRVDQVSGFQFGWAKAILAGPSNYKSQ